MRLKKNAMRLPISKREDRYRKSLGLSDLPTEARFILQDASGIIGVFRRYREGWQNILDSNDIRYGKFYRAKEVDG